MPAALDPQFQAVLDALDAADAPPLSSGTAQEARDGYRRLALLRRGEGFVPEEVDAVVDETVDGPAGPVPVRIYTPADPGDAADLRAVTWLHGGGWVLGDLDTHDPLCRRVANLLRATVVSVDYRLAPEHPHPAPLDDAVAAVTWTGHRYPDAALGVAGDSAGASLAAGVARRLAGTRLAGQFLAYPALDPTMSRPSIEANGTGLFLSAEDMRWFYAQYLPTPELAADPDVAPLADGPVVPSGLAPAVVTTATFDPLHDDGVDYAAALRAAGVRVIHVEGEGLLHGFLGFLGMVDAADATGARALAAFAGILDGSRPGSAGGS